MERTNNQYNLYNHHDFITSQINSVFRGTGIISYLGPKICYLTAVPEKFQHKKKSKQFLRIHQNKCTS